MLRYINSANQNAMPATLKVRCVEDNPLILASVLRKVYARGIEF